MLGCHSHRFNLAVQEILSIHESSLTVTSSIKQILRNLVHSAQAQALNKFTPYSEE